MGLFGQSVVFDVDVEKATSENNTTENWSAILDVCDKTSSNPRNAKDCLKAIMKRMGHNDPHVVMQAITLLDACVNNCGKAFHLEIASREFQNEFLRLLGKALPKISLRMCQVLKSWAEGEFKTDPELNLIPSLFEKVCQEKHEIASAVEKTSKSSLKTASIKDSTAKQEEDDLAKAIELSLKEVKNSPKHAASTSNNNSSQYSSLYPNVAAASTTTALTSQSEPHKVRALYDFEAAEENELTFVAGDIIHVTDDSDPNWWKGYNQQGGDGLFPSNFVTSDLSVDPERLEINQQHKIKKNSQFEEDSKELQHKTEAAAVAAASQHIDIDERNIDRLLHLLNEANPEDPSQDTEEMLRLEQEVNQMGPLIDAELERVDRKHAQLSQLSSDLVDAINLYHSLMRDDRNFIPSTYQFTGSVPGISVASPYQGMQQNPQVMHGTGSRYHANYGPQSLQGNLSLLPYSGPSGNFQTQMGMPMQYMNGQHQLQGMPSQSNHHSIPNQQLSAYQTHSQQIYQPPNSVSHILPANVGTNADAIQQQPSQNQHYQVLQLSQQLGTPTSSPVPTGVLTTNPTHPIQPASNQQTHFVSPQHSTQQQSQPTETFLTNSHHNVLSNGHLSYITNQQQQVQSSPSANTHEQYGQQQQQMTNMTIGDNPSYSTNAHNIPIYQQQR